jgi:hypothetical protein
MWIEKVTQAGCFATFIWMTEVLVFLYKDTVLAHKRTHLIYHYLPSDTSVWTMRRDEDERGVRGEIEGWSRERRQEKPVTGESFLVLIPINKYFLRCRLSHQCHPFKQQLNHIWCLRFWGKNQRKRTPNTEHRVPWNLFSRETKRDALLLFSCAEMILKWQKVNFWIHGR